jgi:hypothetical protein
MAVLIFPCCLLLMVEGGATALESHIMVPRLVGHAEDSTRRTYSTRNTSALDLQLQPARTCWLMKCQPTARPGQAKPCP